MSKTPDCLPFYVVNLDSPLITASHQTHAYHKNKTMMKPAELALTVIQSCAILLILKI